MPRRSRKSHIRTDGTRYGRKKQVAGDSLAYSRVLGSGGVQVTGTLGDSGLENELKQQWQQQAQSGASQMAAKPQWLLQQWLLRRVLEKKGLIPQSTPEEVLQQLQPGSIEQLGQQAAQMGGIGGGTYLQAPFTYDDAARARSGDPVDAISDKAMKLPCLESGVRKITFEEEEK